MKTNVQKRIIRRQKTTRSRVCLKNIYQMIKHLMSLELNFFRSTRVCIPWSLPSAIATKKTFLDLSEKTRKKDEEVRPM